MKSQLITLALSILSAAGAQAQMPTPAQIQSALGMTVESKDATKTVYVFKKAGSVYGHAMASNTPIADRISAEKFCSSIAGQSLVTTDQFMGVTMSGLIIAFPELSANMITNTKVILDASQGSDGGGVVGWTRGADATTAAAVGDKLMVMLNGTGPGSNSFETLADLNKELKAAGQPEVSGLATLCVDQALVDKLMPSDEAQ